MDAINGVNYHTLFHVRYYNGLAYMQYKPIAIIQYYHYFVTGDDCKCKGCNCAAGTCKEGCVTGCCDKSCGRKYILCFCIYIIFMGIYILTKDYMLPSSCLFFCKNQDLRGLHSHNKNKIQLFFKNVARTVTHYSMYVIITD